MKYFCHESYERLLQSAKSADPENREIIRDATQDCLQYVQTVCQGENLLNTAEEYDRETVSDYDRRRHNAHENAISSVSLLNRLSADPVFTGDIADRHQIADFCLELAGWLFRERRRVL